MVGIYISSQGEEFKSPPLQIGKVHRIQVVDRQTPNQFARDIYVATSEQQFEQTPRYSDMAKVIQFVLDEPDIAKLQIYISRDSGKTFDQSPIYDSPGRIVQIAYDNSNNKIISVSQDGKSFPPSAVFNVGIGQPQIIFNFATIPPVLPEKPTEGKVKPGGWGANTDAKVWQVTKMNNPPNLFKVVDDKGVNVATDFTTEQKAMEYISYYRLIGSSVVVNGGGSPGGTVGRNVYKITGKTHTTKSSGFKTRHYASGKPDDTTIEFNAENCQFEAYEAYGYFTIGKPEHDDQLDVKLWGPHHQDGQGAWYIFAIVFSDGETNLGWEQPHPHTESAVVKGKAFGDITGREIGFKGVIWPLEGGGGHVEGYIDLQDGKGWQLGVSADNIGGKKFKKDANQQVQFRIDAAPKLKERDVIIEEIAVPAQKVA